MAETLPFKAHSRDFFMRLQMPPFGFSTLETLPFEFHGTATAVVVSEA